MRNSRIDIMVLKLVGFFMRFTCIIINQASDNSKTNSYDQNKNSGYIYHNFLSMTYFSSECFSITTPRAIKAMIPKITDVYTAVSINFYKRLINFCILLSTANASVKSKVVEVIAKTRLDSEIIVAFCTIQMKIAKNEAINAVRYNLNRFSFSLTLFSVIQKKLFSRIRIGFRMLVKRLLVVSFIALSYVMPSFASSSPSKSSHCNTLSGWHFYCDEAKQEVPSKPQNNTEQELQQESNQQNQTQPKPYKYYRDKIEEIKEAIENKKAKAIIEPTPSNVKDYMIEQQNMSNKASTFGDAWQRVIWQNPELDYTLKRPVSKLGKETYLDTKKEEITTILSSLSKRFGIFYIFKSTCPYCHKYSPILKYFSQKYNFKISPISIDGGYMPDFTEEETLINKGNLESLGIPINTVPATILFDAKTKEVIPIGFGLLSVDELEERIYMLTSRKVGEDY